MTVNANNQLLTFGNTTLTYDFNGNMTSATDSFGTATYTWDAKNRLTGITAPSLSVLRVAIILSAILIAVLFGWLTLPLASVDSSGWAGEGLQGRWNDNLANSFWDGHKVAIGA